MQKENETRSEQLKRVLAVTLEKTLIPKPIIADLITEIDKLSLIAFGSTECRDTILEYIYSKEEIQNSVLEFLSSYLTELMMEGVTKTMILEIYNYPQILVNSGLDDTLAKSLKNDNANDLVMALLFLMKINVKFIISRTVTKDENRI